MSTIKPPTARRVRDAQLILKWDGWIAPEDRKLIEAARRLAKAVISQSKEPT